MNKLLIKKRSAAGQYVWMGKALLFVLVISLFFYKIQDPDQFGEAFKVHLHGFLSNVKTAGVIGIVILLMPLNWILEALKWKRLVAIKQQLSLKEALQGVVTGLSLAFVTPHAIGDYFGRIAVLKGEDKTQFIGSLWVGNFIQMSITLLFGVYGLAIFYDNTIREFPATIVISSLLLIVLALTGFLLFLKSERKNWMRKIQAAFIIILQYKSRDLFYVAVVAMLRYFVFSFQFLLLLLVLDITLSIPLLFAGISWIFLFKSIIPSFNFMSDLGIRELSALTFFDAFEVSQSAVVIGSLLLWLINISIPVIVGLYFIIQMKINPKT